MPDSQMSDGELSVDRVIAQYLEAEQEGRHPDPETYVARYPKHARSLRSFFTNYRRLQTAAPAMDQRHASTLIHAATETSKVITGAQGQGSVVISEAVVLPQQFGRYKIERMLGKGGMGAVFLAEDTQLHRKVALKVPTLALPDDPEIGERFQREARAAATLHHPNICPVHDVGEINGIRYLTMAYIEGATLSKVIAGGKPVTPTKAASAVRKLALALQHAHEHGIVHRDLKSGNVMVDRRGEPILMDFGLARFAATLADIRVTQSGMILGTPGYMSPEHLAGDSRRVGPQADLYSLGVIFYELLTGRLPFDAPLAHLVRQILMDAPPAPSRFVRDLPPLLEAICLKMIAKDPHDRYANMNQVAEALTAYLRDPGAHAVTAQAPPAPAAAVASVPADDSVQNLTKSVTGSESLNPPRRATPRQILWRASAVAAVVALLSAAAWHWNASHRGIPGDAPVKDDGREIAEVGEPEEVPRVPDEKEVPGGPIRANELQLIHTLAGATAPGAAINFSPDGNLLAAAGDDGTVRVWNLEQPAVILELAVGSPVRGVYFLSDNSQILVVPGGHKHPPVIWNIVTRERVAELETAPDDLTCAALLTGANGDPASGRLAAGTAKAGVLVWNLGDRRFQRLDPGPPSVSSVAFLPNGEAVLAGDEDGTISVIPVEPGKATVAPSAMQGHAGSVVGIAPFPNNRHFVSVSSHGEMWLWDLARAVKVNVYSGDDGQVAQARLLPAADGRPGHAATTGRDGIIRIWDLAAEKIEHEVSGGNAEGGGLAVAADGRRLAAFAAGAPGPAKNGNVRAAGVNLQVWQAPLLPPAHPGFPPVPPPLPVVPAPTFPVKTSDEVPFLELAHELEGHAGTVRAVCITGNGNFGFSDGSWPDGDRTIRKWNLRGGDFLGGVERKTESVTGLAVTPDGNLLFAGTRDGVVRLSSGEDAEELQVFSISANATAITQNGLQGYSLADDGTLWKLDFGHDLKLGPKRLPHGQNDVGNVLRLSPNEQLLAAGGLGKIVMVWNLKSNNAPRKLPISHGLVEDLDFSPDGGLLAAIDGSGHITIWDVATWEPRVPFKGHGENTPQSENSAARTLKWGTALAFVDDGDYLVSAGKDETLRLWHVPTGREVGRQLVPTGPVWSIATARGTDLLLTGGEPTSQDPARKDAKAVPLHVWRLKRPFPEKEAPRGSAAPEPG
jgi:WD40 repeat protein/predicted Ser/Thr protein kinase